MIVKLRFKNFYSVREEQEISFEAKRYDDLEDYYIIEPIKGVRLLKMILLYGANASGKTNFLKVIDFLRNLIISPNSRKSELLNFNPFLFDDYSKNENSEIEITFIVNQKKYLYQVIFNRRCIVEESLNIYRTSKASKVFNRKTDEENQLVSISFGKSINISNEDIKILTNNTLWNNSVLDGYERTNISVSELKDVLEWFMGVLKPMVFSKTELDNFVTNRIQKKIIDQKNIVNILSKADFRISNISITENEDELPVSLIEFLESNVKNAEEREKLSKIKEAGKIIKTKLDFIHHFEGGDFSLPFEEQSQGTQRFYGLAGILDLLIRTESIIPVDELESSLHPDLYKHFILMYLVNSKKSQLIATTHNRDILGDKNMFRNDAIWFVEKNKFGESEFYSLDDFGTKVIRNTQNINKAYSIGKLGAVPNISDYYLDIEDEEEKK